MQNVVSVCYLSTFKQNRLSSSSASSQDYGHGAFFGSLAEDANCASTSGILYSINRSQCWCRKLIVMKVHKYGYCI